MVTERSKYPGIKALRRSNEAALMLHELQLWEVSVDWLDSST